MDITVIPDWLTDTNGYRKVQRFMNSILDFFCDRIGGFLELLNSVLRNTDDGNLVLFNHNRF